MTRALREELELVRSLVLPAGDLLLAHLGGPLALQQKGGTEFVTELDRRVEELLLAGLARHFPGDNVLAEESGDTAGSSGRTWYVDPLDGTTNYAHGHPFFSVSVACGDASGLLHGTVLAPYLDELYQGSAGGGAALERPRHGLRRELPRRPEVALERALLATGFPYVRDDIVDRNVGLVRDFLKAPCHGVRRGGSAAIDLAHVAAGTLDGYWEFGLRPWDSAAGTVIARETGCRVSDLRGRQEPLHHREILAAAPGLHARMVALLAPHSLAEAP